MATKKERISFRPGDLRVYKIEKFKKEYNEKNKKTINDTTIMRMAIDLFLEENETDKEVRKYESMIIKILTGIDREEIEKEEYLEKLKKEVEKIYKIIKEKR